MSVKDYLTFWGILDCIGYTVQYEPFVLGHVFRVHHERRKMELKARGLK